jgi:cytochrome bd-type quinol oxidase subunit 2
MTFFVGLVTIIQQISISLGVGSSTLAIANFLAAIADGEIDDTERRMMGIVYVVLRIAMVLILASSVFIFAATYGGESMMDMPALAHAQLLALLVLFANALLMTAHLVPSTIGPAIQGGSWYTLGFLSSLQLLGVTDFTFTTFLLGYITWLVLAIGIVNGLMAMVNQRRAEITLEEKNKKRPV